tara:strand:+ start:263 stop:649 length:387 start_codon:yes stop_codon:yes gene_type:complete
MGVSIMTLDTLDVFAGQALSTKTSNSNGSAKDLVDYEGDILLILNSTAGTGTDTPTLTVKVKDNDESTGSYTDITGGQFEAVTDTASVQKLVLNSNEIKRFIKINSIISGTNPSFTFSVDVVASKKYG